MALSGGRMQVKYLENVNFLFFMQTGEAESRHGISLLFFSQAGETYSFGLEKDKVAIQYKITN